MVRIYRIFANWSDFDTFEKSILVILAISFGGAFGTLLNSVISEVNRNLPQISIATWVSFISLTGIVLTIVISYSSLNRQRHAAARESLEQLDDIQVTRPNAKIKPILHEYYNWPSGKSIVKLQIYQPTDIAGLSEIHSRLMAFPRFVFEDVDVEVVKDGYLVTINSSDPVEIRRQTQNLLQKLTETSGNRSEGNRWVVYDSYVRNYGREIQKENLELHNLLIEYLGQSGPKHLNDIRDHLRDNDYESNLAYLAISELKHEGMISDDPSERDAYRIANGE